MMYDAVFSRRSGYLLTSFPARSTTGLRCIVETMLRDPREIPIVPIATAFVLAVGKRQNRFLSSHARRKNRISWRREHGRSLTNHYRSVSGSGPGPLETKPLMISICIRSFGSFREEVEGPRAPGPPDQVPGELCEKLAYFR